MNRLWKHLIRQGRGRALLLLAFGIAALLPLLSGTPYLLRLGGRVFVYAIIATGLQVLCGLLGVLDLGFILYVCLGAYGFALLGTGQLGFQWPWLAAAGVAVAGSALFALLFSLVTMRLRGDYLAIAALALAEALRLTVINLDRPVNLTNGPNGLVGVPAPPVLKGMGQAGVYIVLAVLAITVLYLYARLRQSAAGARWKVLNEDPLSAQAAGINPRSARLGAYIIGAALAAIGGVCWAFWQGAVFPDNFAMPETVNLYCILVLGGIGSPIGTLAGAVTLVALPEMLREYNSYRLLLFGIMLIGLVRFRPAGLIPESLIGPARRKRAYGPDSPAPRGIVLSARGLTRRFGGLAAVDGVDLEVHAGEIVGLIGPNGAGKSTLLNLLSGFEQPGAGKVTMPGKQGGRKPYQVARQGLARSFQHTRLARGLTVAGNVAAGRRSAGDSTALLDTMCPGLGQKAGLSVEGLTYSERRWVELGRCLAGQPNVLLLDEPAAGMTAAEVEQLKTVLLHVRQSGTGVLLVEHRMDLVMKVCDRIVVMDQGRLIAAGSPAQVRANPQVIDCYLGAKTPLPERKLRQRGSELLRLTGVDIAYGGKRVLHDVNLSVAAGERVCLVGPNAAGKSSLIKCVMGQVAPTRGEVALEGRPVTHLAASLRVACGISLVPEGRGVFYDLTVEENLILGAYALDRRTRSEALQRIYDELPLLYDRRLQKAGTLSGGEQQILAVGRALMPAPRLLLLDEPTMGLSPRMAAQVLEIIVGLSECGPAVIVVEQQARQVAGIADRLYVVNGGTISEAPAGLKDFAGEYLGRDA